MPAPRSFRSPSAARSLRRLLAVLLVGLATIPAACGALGIDRSASWWKGNLHTHSLWSDGNDFPDMIAAWYRERGYDFLALSDHNILSDHDKWMDNDLVVRRGGRRALAAYRERFGDTWVETRSGEDGKLEVRLKTLPEIRARLEEPGSFLMIQSEEITDRFGELPIHINATNIAELIEPRGGASVREVIANNLDAVAEQDERLGVPILPHLNHPNFGWGVTAEDMAHVLQEHFFEVYNGHPGVRHQGDEVHASVERLWDIANTIRIAELDAPPLFGVATDDSHNYHNASGSTPGRGWVMVRAPELTPVAIVEAMRRGAFYASSGVALRWVEFDGRVLELEVEPVADETYSVEFIGTRRDFDPAREPVRGADGEALPVTWRYSADVGAVLGVGHGTHARYELKGDELYVRAVVTSSAVPDNPVFEDQRKQAWTQPVGWRAER